MKDVKSLPQTELETILTKIAAILFQEADGSWNRTKQWQPVQMVEDIVDLFFQYKLAPDLKPTNEHIAQP
jgi:hypothetical protein